MNYRTLIIALCVLVSVINAITASSLEARSNIQHHKSSKVASTIHHHHHHHKWPEIKSGRHFVKTASKSSKHHHSKGRKHHASNSSSITSRIISKPLGLQKGQGTWYNTGLGACGLNSSDSDRIVALSELLFDLYTPKANPNDNTLCGTTIRVAYNNSTSTVTVVDRCTGCQKFDLDLSPTAFEDLADPNIGRIDIDWEFV